ncbi:tetratricopeptide repeat protein [Paraglaciecola polaris]|uniref:Tetratricopeptide TPR_2 n=1 Tax=Paraglaciecola polaris LMG 21857 TaxID=1129793 RepID=K6ZWL4_9ALTE|nr:tetratricopeptide repeat protein [Paraglaciecola polaris]GAC33173.1 tetratricopeptide TPR_2 [Paraglaciecola polaris LMG 21857]
MTNGQHTDTPFNKARSRGIRASQQKLRTAQLAAGFKSQAEVVDKVQSIEGLDKAPRSLVSRVFRGEPVDPLSIERVAKALNVEAWALYLDSAEVEKKHVSSSHESGNHPENTGSAGIENTGPAHTINNQQHVSHESSPAQNKDHTSSSTIVSSAPQSQGVARCSPQPAEAQTNANIFGTQKAYSSPSRSLLLITLVVVLGVFLLERFWPDNNTPFPGIALAGIVDIDNKVVAVLPINGPRGDDITRNIEQLLAGPTQLIVGSSALHASVRNPQELLRSKKADLVISGELLEIGRYIAVRLFLSQDQNMRQVWSGVFAKSASEKYIKSQLEGGLQTLLHQRPLADIADWYSLQRFLRGMQHFESERSEQIILRGMADYQGVIASAPDLVYGHAGMCLALIEQSIETSHKAYLDDASRHCQNGADINPDALFILVALGNLARVKGQYEQANHYFKRALELDPNSVTALQKLAESQMRLFLQNRDIALFDTILTELNSAASLEPDNWKIPYTQGRAYYFKGEQLAAIKYFRQSANLTLNYQTLNNLGALEFCVGDLTNAKLHYQRALSLHPQHSVLLSNIATLHFYLGEDEQALAIFEPQIKRIQQKGGAGLYQLWSNVADVYRTQGKHKQALDAYRNAMSELDREVSQGEANVMQKASRLAMYILVIELTPNMQTEQLFASLTQQAEAISDVADPVSLHQLALSWLHLGDEQKARHYRDKLHAICPGFAASPDFKTLQNNAPS